jgi:hypothetical protein
MPENETIAPSTSKPVWPACSRVSPSCSDAVEMIGAPGM